MSPSISPATRKKRYRAWYSASNAKGHLTVYPCPWTMTASSSLSANYGFLSYLTRSPNFSAILDLWHDSAIPAARRGFVPSLVCAWLVYALWLLGGNRS
ncbi:hypothetical protein BDV19DRAFT_364828 [Aspergillus venezuelensis]